MPTHSYQLELEWTGNTGKGTKNYQSYQRTHCINRTGKPSLSLSSDPHFRGDDRLYNPEELLISSLSSCHMLWYLHLCSINDIIVESYTDSPKGTMIEHDNGSGEFIEVVLLPIVTISLGSTEKAQALHHEAHECCFIARSVNFEVKCEPSVSLTP